MPRDIIRKVQAGDPVTDTQHNLIVERVRRRFGAPGMYSDETGDYSLGSQDTALGSWEYGVLNGYLNGGAGETAEVAIYRLNSDEDEWEDTGETQEVYAPPLLPEGSTLEEGTWVDIQEHATGKWYVRNAACPPPEEE